MSYIVSGLKAAAITVFVVLAGCGRDVTAPATPAVSSNVNQPVSAVAVCIGLNSVDPDHYAGWDGRLSGCEPDANDMFYIAQTQGFSTKKLLTRSATRAAVLTELRQASARLTTGDIFMLSYSGHGGQLPDQSTAPDEDGLDETWCLYDGEMLDNELYAEFAKFKPGVRILVFSDSCHSETITRIVHRDFDLATDTRGPTTRPELKAKFTEAILKSKLDERTVRAIPPDTALATYRQNKAFYDDISRAVVRPSRPIAPWVLSIAACRDDELAGDGPSNGVFTAALKQVWANGAFLGDYREFHKQIERTASDARPSQHAQSRMIDVESEPYWKQRPFTTATP